MSIFSAIYAVGITRRIVYRAALIARAYHKWRECGFRKRNAVVLAVKYFDL